MTYQELLNLKALVYKNQVKMDLYIRSKGEYTRSNTGAKVENPYNLYAILLKESINAKDTVIEKQSTEADYRRIEENRFLQDFFVGHNPSAQFDKAIGNLRIRVPEPEEEYDKLSDRQKRSLEKRLFKSLVISSAQLLNAYNRMPRTNEVYEKKNECISEYLAYAEMFNARFPEEKMAFGFAQDSQGVAALTGSVPRYSRFSVHLGDPITAANILFDANEKMFVQAPKLGFSYSPILQNTINRTSLAYVKNGAYEIVDSEDSSKVLKTYDLSRIRSNFKAYNAARRNYPKRPLSDSDKQALEPIKQYITYAIHDFIMDHEYPLDMVEYNTGVVNCFDGHGVNNYASIAAKVKDEEQLDIVFNMIFADQNFNKRERMYIAERAGLPLDKLLVVQGLEPEKTFEDSKEAIDWYISSKTQGMNEVEILEFLKKVGKVYRYDSVKEADKVCDFLDALDVIHIGISEEALEEYKVDQLLLLYSENKKDAQELLVNLDYALTLIETLTKNNKMDKLFEVMSVEDIAELLQSIEPGETDLSLFTQGFSEKIKSLSQENLEEILNPEEFEMFRFEAILKNINDDAKKDFLTKSIGAVKDMKDSDKVLKTTITEMETDNETIEQTLSMYNQIRETLNGTTRKSRQEAFAIEQALEEQEYGTDKPEQSDD